MNEPKVSIIILTYDNGWTHLSKCLKSLFEINYQNIEVIIVDNASSDDTLDQISKLGFKNLKLIKNKKNLGFATGNNQAAKKASGKYILLLNNDTVVTPNFLSILVEELEKDRTIGVVQPKIRQMENPEKLDAVASFLTNTGFLYHYGYSQRENDPKFNKPLFMYSAKGACFLTRKELVDEIELFDENYFAYFEETDFCHRVWLSGFKVQYEPSSEIFHLGGPDKVIGSQVQFHSYKNRMRTYIKNLELLTLLKILPIHIFFCLGIATMYILKGRIGLGFAIFKAIAWNFTSLPSTLNKRRIIQSKLRKIEDSDLLPKVQKNVKLTYYKHFLLKPRGYYDFESI